MMPESNSIRFRDDRNDWSDWICLVFSVVESRMDVTAIIDRFDLDVELRAMSGFSL